MSKPSRKVFIRTYGCQMNVYDSERMSETLALQGYETAETPDGADLILLNNCHIREKAAEKMYSELGRLRGLKEAAAKTGKSITIGVAGCVAQAQGEEIIRRAPAVDFVVGPQSYQRLPDLLRQVDRGQRPVDTEFDVTDKFAALKAAKRPVRSKRVAAFVSVQEGCDKFCTFCVVPYTRGAEVSRPADAIVSEAERLADAGVREITLLGQNVNAWRGEADDGRDWGLGQLLARLAVIDGIDRLRYTTSHTRDMEDALIEAHRDLPELMPYLHLPIQSGSDRILAAMNRGHTRRDYLKVIARIRAARPDIALAGDFIVGFPGETEADFIDTMSIVGEAGYAAAYSFKYSARPGTPAASHSDQVPEPVKAERLERLQTLVNRSQAEFIASQVGTVTEVLFERRGRHNGQIVGRSPWLWPVQVMAAEQAIGTIGKVLIERAGPNSLFGSLIEAADPADLSDRQVVDGRVRDGVGEVA
jgi:tRNA-2-methylthio-N6-dimethylallyladenosine synthase